MTQEQRPSATLLQRIAERQGRNRSGQTLWDDEALPLLVAAAVGFADDACDEPECEGCNKAHHIWWDVCNGLPVPLRVLLQAHLIDKGIPLPPGYWEEVR